jgi:hypothetical protein
MYCLIVLSFFRQYLTNSENLIGELGTTLAVTSNRRTLQRNAKGLFL